MKIVIVGAGITGLTAAFRLSQKGHQVIIFEKEKFAGGLASGFKEKGWQWDLESFYHHLFTTDQAAKNLIGELGLADKLFYTRPKTSVFYKNKISQFDSP
ncbi:MAG: FAD-dependent oxidoreductase, partial [bacterium]|nr:FAD-dependent oxidoreductase [bacterium]